MQVDMRVGPIPHGDDDVSLDTLRTRRSRGQGAAGNAIGPVGEHLFAAWAKLIDRAEHIRPSLAGLDTAIPRCNRIRERAQSFGDFSRGFIAQLMAGHAAIRFKLTDPLSLAFHVFRNAIARGSRPW